MKAKRLKEILANISDEAKVSVSYHNKGETCVILVENKTDKSFGQKTVLVYVAG